MKKVIVMICLIFSIVSISGCSGEAEGFNEFPKDKDENISSDLSEREDVIKDDIVKDDVKYNIEKEIEKNGGKIIIGGETYDAEYGENGALIWKKVSATFDTAEHYTFAFISLEQLSENMALIDVVNEIYCTKWKRWEELIMYDFSVTSIGEDMFEVCTSTWGTDSLVFINGKENKFFSLNSMGVPQIYRGNEKKILSDVNRLNRFDDGKMLVEATYRYYKSGYDVPDEEEYLWVDEYGNYIIIEDKEVFSDYMYESIYLNEKYYYVHSAGPFSDGMFYYQGIFYDYNMNAVLNIRQNGYIPCADEDKYAPEFRNGVCKMLVYKNGSFWTFDINRNGEMITEVVEVKVEKMDEWLSNYEQWRRTEELTSVNPTAIPLPTATPVPTATPIPTATPKPIRNLYGMEIIIGDHFSPESPKAPTNAKEAAVWQYRQELFAKYNFTLQSRAVAGWGEMQDTCERSILAGEPVAELFELDYRFVAEPMTKGCFYDLATLEELDFSEEKWNKSVKEVMTKGNSIYGMSTSKSQPRGGVIWNKRLFEEAGLDPDLPYDFQASGEWTWSKFEEMCERLTRDINGDGVTDIYATVSQDAMTLSCLVASTGSDFFIKDMDGNLVNNMGSEDVLSALDFAVKLYDKGYEMPQPKGSNWDYYQDAFREGKAVMQFNEEYICNSYNEMWPDDEFGFIMPPKPDGASSYHSYVCDNITIIPSCYDEETAGNIAFAYNLYTMAYSEYEDADDWKAAYYEHFDDTRAVDETITMFNDGMSVHFLTQVLVPGDLGEDLMYKYPFAGTTPEKTVKSIKKEWDAILEDVNNAY